MRLLIQSNITQFQLCDKASHSVCFLFCTFLTKLINTHINKAFALLTRRQSVPGEALIETTRENTLVSLF